MTILYLPAYCK